MYDQFCFSCYEQDQFTFVGPQRCTGSKRKVRIVEKKYSIFFFLAQLDLNKTLMEYFIVGHIQNFCIFLSDNIHCQAKI